MSDSMIQKIRKLLALAADPSAEGAESENAARMATRLMLKHGIEESQLKGEALDTIRCGFAYARHMNASVKKAPAYTGFIAIGVAAFLGPIVSWTRRVSVATGEEEDLFKFSGEINDVKFSVWLHETLCAQGLREWKSSKTTESKVAWLNGWGCAVQARLKEMGEIRKSEESDMKASDSTALIVLDKKVAIVTEKFGQQSSEKKDHKISNDGWAAGMRTVIPTGALAQGESNKQLAA